MPQNNRTVSFGDTSLLQHDETAPEIPIHIALTPEQRAGGIYILGLPRYGKTTLMINMMLQDARNDLGFLFIDPHGDAVYDILARLPYNRLKDVILIDPTDEYYSFSLNLFECKNVKDIREVSSVISSVKQVFSKLFVEKTDDGATMGITLETTLLNLTILFIYNQQYTLADASRLLQNKDALKKLVQNIDQRRHLNNYLWWMEYIAMKKQDSDREVLSTIRRLLIFTTDEYVKHIVGQAKSTLNFRDIIDNKKIVLVRVPAEELPDLGILTGKLIIDRLVQAVFSRGNIDKDDRPYFGLYCDEFQNYATDDMARLFTGTGKYHLLPTVAHQERTGQISKNDLVIGATDVAVHKILLQVGTKDAKTFASTFALASPAGEPIREQIMERQFKTETVTEWIPPESEQIYNRLLKEKDGITLKALLLLECVTQEDTFPGYNVRIQLEDTNAILQSLQEYTHWHKSLSTPQVSNLLNRIHCSPDEHLALQFVPSLNHEQTIKTLQITDPFYEIQEDRTIGDTWVNDNVTVKDAIERNRRLLLSAPAHIKNGIQLLTEKSPGLQQYKSRDERWNAREKKRLLDSEYKVITTQLVLARRRELLRSVQPRSYPAPNTLLRFEQNLLERTKPDYYKNRTYGYRGNTANLENGHIYAQELWSDYRQKTIAFRNKIRYVISTSNERQNGRYVNAASYENASANLWQWEIFTEGINWFYQTCHELERLLTRERNPTKYLNEHFKQYTEKHDTGIEVPVRVIVGEKTDGWRSEPIYEAAYRYKPGKDMYMPDQMQSYMEGRLSSIPKFIAYAKIAHEVNGVSQNSKVKIRIPNMPPPPPPSERESRRNNARNNTRQQYCRLRDDIDDEIYTRYMALIEKPLPLPQESEPKQETEIPPKKTLPQDSEEEVQREEKPQPTKPQAQNKPTPHKTPKNKKEDDKKD